MPATSSTVRAIYRCLLRDARELQRTPHFNVRRGLQLEQWGNGGFVEPLSEKSDDAKVLTSLEEFQRLRDNALRMGSPSVDVAKSIRLAFRDNSQLNDPKVTMTVTNGVRIEATSKYVESHSDPATNTYRFAYRVAITNQNTDSSVQILGRQYTFESEKGQRIALPRNSPGVVGATPVLAPGQTFEYASGVDIDAPRGSVTGCLHALRKTEEQDDDGDTFDALVSKFALLAPSAN
uniref:ApaG domain-containing protein n=1 Tax=Phytophthora ramorum TaxID=164328 RepID=H3GFN7_PHYRM